MANLARPPVDVILGPHGEGKCGQQALDFALQLEDECVFWHKTFVEPGYRWKPKPAVGGIAEA